MKVNFILLFLSFAFSNHVQGSSFFGEGNRLYLTGKYGQAIEQYQKVQNKGAEVYFNMGNSYYQLGKIGYAINSYRQALKLRPREGDFLFNLQHARKKVRNKIDYEKLDGPTYLFPLSMGESVFLFLVFYCLFWIVLIIKKTIGPKDWLSFAKWGSVICQLILIIPILYLSSRPDIGVVKTEKAEILSERGPEAIVLFALSEGVEFRIEKSLKDWVKISFLDGKKGWVKRSQVLASGF